MPLTHLPAVTAGAFVLLLAACGGESTAPRRDGALTADEANALALQMGLPFSGAVPTSVLGASADDGRLGAGGDPFRLSIDTEVRCERGGTARVTAEAEGDIDHATQSLSLDFEGTFTPDDCGHRVHGLTIWTSALDGDEPSLTITAHVETRNGRPVGVHTTSVAGRFAWRTSDGRSGRCTVDFDATVNYTTRRALVDGQFCGSTIRFDGPLTN
jgi:hypothetical protein